MAGNRINSFAHGWKKAFLWSSADYSLYFEADDGNLNFDNRNLTANDYYSGGLFFLGLCLIVNRGAQSRPSIACSLKQRFLPAAKHSADFLQVLL